MKRLIMSTLMLGAVAAMAQAADMATDTSLTSSTPAVASPSSTNPYAPVEGRNSFTEAQARKRIGKDGFTNIAPLTKGGDGVWRTTATKGGKTYPVSLDYQGNITTDK